MRRNILVFCVIGVVLLGITGCAIMRKSVSVSQVVLLPEDRIYTVPAGQKIDVVLDGKPYPGLVFPTPMKLTHESVLVRQEENLNNAILDKTHAQKQTNKWIGIFGGVLTVVGGVFGMIMKSKAKKA